MPYLINDKCNGCTACAKTCPTHAITGARKEIHVIDPETCVDCGVCGMICPVPEAVTDQDGKVCVMIHRKDRPRPQPVAGARCVSCNLCVEVCPFGCLGLVIPDGAAERRPLAILVNEKRCVSCELCVSSCPTVYLEMRKAA